jgi:GABA(A) receptor-associated protein
MNFKKTFTYEQRQTESLRILSKHPERIPIICCKSLNSNVPILDKHKYLVPRDLTLGQFIYIIRTRLKLDKEKGLYLFFNGIIPANNELITNIYDKYKDSDGFLYVYYTSENTFG